MRLVSESVCALMPSGSRQVLLAPTHTCTSLLDHVLLTSAKSEIPNPPCQNTWTSNLVLALIIFDIITISLFISLRSQPCLSYRVLIMFEFCFFPTYPSSEVCGKVGNSTWMQSAAPHRRRVCLSVLLRSQPVIWGEIRVVWDFKLSGREKPELPISAFWSFDSFVSKQSGHIRLKSVWCSNF